MSRRRAPRPPHLARLLLSLLLPRHRGDEFVFDLGEEYVERRAVVGAASANLWYWAQVVRPSTFNFGRELREVRTMRVGKRKVVGVAPKTLFGFLVSELRFAVRSLRHRPGFSALVVLTLALGIGANTAIFTVVNGVLLEPLAYPEPGSLVRIGPGWDPEGPLRNMSYPDAIDVEAQSASLESLVTYSNRTFTMTGRGEPVLVRGTSVHKGLLETFGLAPALGRDLSAEESGRAPARVAIVGYGFWRDVFDGSRDALGQTLLLDAVPYEVVGVAPAGFDYPGDRHVWVPSRSESDGCQRGCHAWYTIGRLTPTGSLASLSSELDVIAPRLAEAYPDTNFEKTFISRTLHDEVVRDARTGLWLLLGAGLAVLLIACANVANLMLARAETRRGEAAVRAAVGASQGRLVISMMSESVLLSTLGAVGGLALATGGVRLVRSISAGAIPRLDTLVIDGRVILFTVVLAVSVTLLFGLSPAVRASRAALAARVRRAGRGGAIGGGHRLRRLSTMSQTALAVVLLFGAGLMLRTFVQLYAVDPGFETDQVLRFDVQLPAARYEDLESIRTFYRSLERQIAQIPGVESVASIQGAPLGANRTTGDVLVEGRPEPPPGEEISAAMRPIGPGYLETMEIPLIAGRDLTEADDRSEVPVALISETLARLVFGEGDPLGERIRVTVSMGFGSPYWEVVGVTRDVRPGLTEEPIAELFVPHGQFGPRTMTVNARASVPAAGLVGAVRAEVERLDRDLPLRNVETVSDAVRRHVAPARFLLVMVSAFAGLALTLAAVGLYGVMAYLVSRRVREIGLRVALGAQSREVLRLVMVGALGPALTGLGLGIVIALAGGRVVESVLYGVSSRDPWTLVVAPIVLLAIAVCAVWLPARRASRVDPAKVLRAR
ncbi:MAG: ABC transporter permease [Gemmatimonadetes bacterium]|nr:ABC transporter permease [Gemmatimonadota bacterium]